VRGTVVEVTDGARVPREVTRAGVVRRSVPTVIRRRRSPARSIT
jgi:hypothetical protein